FAASIAGRQSPESLQPDEAPPFSGYGFETPASLAFVYQLVTAEPGCNPNTVTANPTGGSRAIAVVDAYDDPLAAPDLAYFSAQFGLPFSPGPAYGGLRSSVPAPRRPNGRLGIGGVVGYRVGACHGSQSSDLLGGGRLELACRPPAGRIRCK
ncbi:MAG: hypothetical protein ACRD22_22850, partial [Terriglobia bacterium]